MQDAYPASASIVRNLMGRCYQKTFFYFFVYSRELILKDTKIQEYPTWLLFLLILV